jgi:probable rRNA maturation factor
MVDFVIKKKFQSMIDVTHFKHVIELVFAEMKIHPIPGISVLITDNKEIKSLNDQYRGVNQPTDVLSFNNEYIEPDTGQKHLGDIAISYPFAQKQAEAGSNPVTQELELLLVHGCLHLLGFDHDSDVSQQKMWEIQKSILKQLNNPIQPIKIR